MKITHIVPALVYITVEAENEEQADNMIRLLSGETLESLGCVSKSGISFDTLIGVAQTQPLKNEEDAT